MLEKQKFNHSEESKPNPQWQTEGKQRIERLQATPSDGLFTKTKVSKKTGSHSQPLNALRQIRIEFSFDVIRIILQGAFYNSPNGFDGVRAGSGLRISECQTVV